MTYNRDPRSRWRTTDHERRAAGPSAAALPPDSPRELHLVFYPMRDTTLATLLVTSRAGDRRWDRRDGTFTVDIGSAELEGLLPDQALRVLLRSVLRDL